MCFDNIIEIEVLDFNTLLNKKSYENFLIYDISYKTLIDGKPLHIIFDKMHIFVKDYNGIKFVALFSS